MQRAHCGVITGNMNIGETWQRIIETQRSTLVGSYWLVVFVEQSVKVLEVASRLKSKVERALKYIWSFTGSAVTVSARTLDIR